MTARGVESLKADHQEVLAIAKSLSDDEWLAPSGCEGWRTKDVVAHLACTFRTVAEPGTLPPGVAGDLEGTQEVGVAERKDWDSARVLAEYEDLGAKAIEALAGLQTPGVAETVIPLEDAGHYPLHLVANALAFDHYCHLRNDILQPRGSVDRPAPPHDDLRLGATMEWLLAGLPQMPGQAIIDAVTAPVLLELTGPGGGTWTIRPGVEVVDGDAGDAAATITSSAQDFVVWSTLRASGRESNVTIDGDKDLAERVLDAIHLF
jgi:uncharacterized protein (TIGR03083 family)